MTEGGQGKERAPKNAPINAPIKLTDLQQELLRELRHNEAATYDVLAEHFSKDRATIKPLFAWHVIALSRLVDDLDVAGTDQFDARIEQLRNVLFSTTKLVLALAQVQHGERLVSEVTIEKSQEILCGMKRG